MSSDSLNTYLKKGLQQSDERTDHCISIGKDGEEFGRPMGGGEGRGGSWGGGGIKGDHPSGWVL